MYQVPGSCSHRGMNKIMAFFGGALLLVAAGIAIGEYSGYLAYGVAAGIGAAGLLPMCLGDVEAPTQRESAPPTRR